MKRVEILDRALDVIAEHGYSKATVKELAESAGISQNGLLHYFGSKDALLIAALRHQDERNVMQIDPEHHDFSDELVDGILAAIADEDAAPGTSQLTIRLASDATDPEHVGHEFFRERYNGILNLVSGAIAELQNRGNIAPTADPAVLASLIYAAWDGMRIQWLYDSSIDIRSRMLYLLRQLGLAS